MKTMDRLIAAIIILALLGGLFTLGQRFMDDRNNRTVQIAMDYADLYARQDLWQVPLATYLAELKERGLQAVVLRESTVEDMVLRGTISVISGQQMLEQQRTGNLDIEGLGELTPQVSYVFGNDLGAMARLQAELVRKYGETRVEVLSMSEPWGMAVQIGYSSLMGQRIGFLQEDLDTIGESGLDILPILYNYSRISAERFEAVIRELELYGPVRTVLFDGSAVTGFPNHLNQTVLNMNYRNLVMGLIQPADTLVGYTPVTGTEELLAGIQYRGARTYMVSRGITNNITTGAMISRWINSIREYNVHVLYLRPFHYGSQGESAAQRNLNYVDELVERIYASGYETGAMPTYPETGAPHPWLRVLLMWGIGAAGLMLLHRLFRISWMLQVLALIFLGALAAATVYVSRLAILQWGWALGGAIVFPVLAMTLLLQTVEIEASGKDKSGWQKALAAWAGTTLMTVCGTVIVAALITTPRFILDVDYFRGVKVSYITPLILIVLVYYWYSAFTRERNGCIVKEVKELLSRALTFKDLIAGGIILAMLAFYLLRSGNMEISALEMTVREWLDRVLIVRPRTKEFLVGHPFLILAVAAASMKQRKMLVVLFGLGAIGQISIMNTFMHIRTPLLESMIRTGNGLWLGALVGMLLVWVWKQGQQWLVDKQNGPVQTENIACEQEVPHEE